jgi:AAA+ superfamily predicted ATPase
VAGRQLKQLLQAHRDGDDLAFRRAAQEIIEEEEGKRHIVLAQDLRKLLAASGGGAHAFGDDADPPTPPLDRDGETYLAVVRRTHRRLQDLTIPPQVRRRLVDLVREIPRWPELDAQAIPRRQMVLLYGPPGCGKTSVAEALAAELGLPLAIVRIDAVMSSYLGETAANLRRVFEYATNQPHVVLFDEFDALGKQREDDSDHGELRRVVTAVLQMMDAYRGPSLLVAATNYSEILDRAIWRRFDEVIQLPLPTPAQLRRLLTLVLSRHLAEDVELSPYVKRLSGMPHAAAEMLAYDARRGALLDGRRAVRRDDLERSVEAIAARRWS